MTSFDANGFASFFSTVHNGRTPFPWQQQVVEQVLESGVWPELIDVPTGLGKTSMLDAAVYLLASCHDRPDGVRSPRRIFFVVDRRLVVDEAYEHAGKLVAALAASADGVTRDVAEALRSLHGDSRLQPLVATRMRGGTTWDASWVDRPDQAAIVVGTVDQIGSRLLFRGYGTTDFRKPMDAALVGTDSLIFVDEAHLAEPMLQTVARAHALDTHGIGITPRACIVQLTATPGTSSRALAFDVGSHEESPVAWERLTARKSLRLAQCDAKRKPEAIAALTVELLTHRPGARALVVCNTVAAARRTHAAVLHALRRSGLHLRVDDDNRQELPELVIGRARPIDRDRRVPGLMHRFGVDGQRPPDECIDVLVATQTVEVGANLDVDVLVSESAPLGALVQRLGRLNRLGRSPLEDPTAVVVDDGQVDDPVYGSARRETWTYLEQRVGGVRPLDAASTSWPSIPASPLDLRELVGAAPAHALSGQSIVTPDLGQPTLRSWARTSPRPEPDAPVGPYLHGINADVRTVTMFWRDDLFDGAEGSWNQRLVALPYVAAESIEMPFLATRAWLAKAPAVDVADVDASAVSSADVPLRNTSNGRILIRSGESWRLADHSQIVPGDIIAVAAEQGGLDDYGWDPVSAEPVTDVRDLASLAVRRARPTLRLDARTCARVLSPDADNEHKAAIEDVVTAAILDPDMPVAPGAVDERPVTDRLIDALREALDSDSVRPEYLELIARLTNNPSALEIIQVANSRLALAQITSKTPDETTCDDDEAGSSAGTGRVRLDAHHRAVGDRAARICAALGLDPTLKDLVVYAAAHHDLGKIDARFQAMLSDGNVLMAELLDEPLAKSGVRPYSPLGRAARRRSGLPGGFRHEAWSAKLVAQLVAAESWPAWATDLLIHLVAAHHGRGRPLLPAVPDDRPRVLVHGNARVTTTGEQSIDLSAAARFDRLNDQFGYWGLALLETIVRCADQTCSAEGT